MNFFNFAARHGRFRVISGLFVGLWCAVPAPAAVRYVDQKATGDGTGVSWVNACREVQNALLSAQDKDEIWIAAGTVHDRWDNSLPVGLLTNPAGPQNGNLRTVRGGHFGLGASAQTSWWRQGTEPETLSPNLGFRVALARPLP